MLDKGSAHWSKEQLAQQLELMGTSLDFESENFFSFWESDVVREDLPQYLSMLSDVLQHPSFSEEELEKSKKQTIASIQAATSDTTQVATNVFYSTVYKPDCVYYQEKFPDQINDAKKVNVAQLKAFHQAQYTPANTVMAIVGDVDPDTAFNLVGKEFSDWKGGGPSTIDVGPCRPATAGIRIDTPLTDKTNVEVFMGEPAPLDIHSPDFYAASLANAALGHDTVSSRLAELRNKHGLTYGISSYFSENAFANAPWVIDFTVNPENLAKSLPIVNQIVAGYRHGGITKEELENESNRLAGEYIVERMRTPKQLADALTKYEILGLGAKFMDDYPHNLKAVKIEQVNKAIDKYFNPKNFVTSVAGTIPGKTTSSQASAP
jgi:zinc protease